MTRQAPLTIERDGLWVRVTGANQYRAALQSIGARWRADNSWRFPLTVSHLNALARAGVPIGTDDPALKVVPDQPWLVPAHDCPRVKHPTWPKLYPYQREAVDFLCASPYPGALLALSPGLGKTIVAIVAAEMLDAQSVLTICPKVLIPVWRQERQKWSTLPWNDSSQAKPRLWSTMNWEYALRHEDEVLTPWDIVICDESVLLKNRQTQRYKLAKKLRRHTGRMWQLSGSPVTRYVDDLWTQLHLIFPDGFGSFWRFAQEYCFIDDNPWGGRDITGSRPYATSQEWRDLMFARNQAEVLPDLPSFVEQSIPVELVGEQKRLYRKAQDDLLVELEGQDTILANRVSQLMRLQQITSHPANLDSGYRGPVAKLDALMELIDSGALAKPILIWTYYRQTAFAIEQALTKAGHSVGLVIGDTPNSEAILAAYKEGKTDILILSLSVGRFGLTLTRTRSMVYVDRTFDADSFIQSMARVQRLGLDHTFHVVSLYAPHTVDEFVIGNIAQKLPAITRVSGGDLAEMLRAL